MTSDRSDQSAWPPGRRLAAAIERLERHRRQAEQRSRLNRAELRLLWLLSDGKPRSLRHIAESLRLEQSTVNRQVNAALSSGVVDRFRSSDTGSYAFTASEEGQSAFETELSQTLGGYEAALSQMGPGRAERLLELLEEFVEAYGRTASASDDAAARVEQ